MAESAGRLFGTDGVRGKANVDLTAELAFNLGRAAGEGTGGVVVIGRDTRRSGPMLSAALHAGFNAVGADSVDLGIIPVGGVSRLTRATGSFMGVMVSASHNPADDNGIKFFGADGAKLPDEAEDRIASRVEIGGPWRLPGGASVGFQSVMADSIHRYVDELVSDFDYSLRGMELVLDCANGAAFQAAPLLFERLGASVELLAAEPDGMNINSGCGATTPEFLAKRTDGRIGLAFDGDADRLIAVDEDGVPANGDVLMAIFARHLKDAGKLKNDAVVTTVMANFGFRRAMDALGIEVIETKVGDRYVLEAMRESRSVLGGEQSGHIVLEDRSSGDGLRSGLRLLSVLAATGKPLTELRKVMTEYPQVLFNVPVGDKHALAEASTVWNAVRAATDRLGSAGRVLVRASGTEPLVRVMVEATRKDLASAVATELSEVVKQTLG